MNLFPIQHSRKKKEKEENRSKHYEHGFFFIAANLTFGSRNMQGGIAQDISILSNISPKACVSNKGN